MAFQPDPKPSGKSGNRSAGNRGPSGAAPTGMTSLNASRPVSFLISKLASLLISKRGPSEPRHPGIDPGPLPAPNPDPSPAPEPDRFPALPVEPDPAPQLPPGPMPVPQPVT